MRVLPFLAAFLLSSAVAAAQPKRGGSLLYGGISAPRRAPVPQDPWLPTGVPLFSGAQRPSSGPEPAACSFSRPVCVHRGAGVAGPTALQALAALEQAYEHLVLALGLPPPVPDLGRGGTDDLDLYLLADAEPDLMVHHDPPELSFVDRASAFCTLAAPQRTRLDRAATQCVGEAIALRLDASESPHLRRSFATHLWLATHGPSSADLQAIDEFQANPQLSLARREVNEHSEGAAVFLEFLDFARGRATSGLLSAGLLTLSSGKTAPNARCWNNEPDIFDVLRHSLGNRPRPMAELMADFAVARAFMGDRDDGSHLPTLDWAGPFGRVRFDWVIEASSLPRRVAAAYPIEPTGSIYVWLVLDQISANTTLGFQAEWEPPVSFSWVLVRVAKDGRELSRLSAPFRQRGTKVEQRLENLKDAGAVLVVGTNLGGIDPSHPFDPDVTPFEAHSCTVYLVKL